MNEEYVEPRFGGEENVTFLRRLARFTNLAWRVACAIALGVGIGFLWHSFLWGVGILLAAVWCSLSLSQAMIVVRNQQQPAWQPVARIAARLLTCMPAFAAWYTGQPALALLTFAFFAFHTDEVAGYAFWKLLAIFSVLGALALLNEALVYLHLPPSTTNGMVAALSGLVITWRVMYELKPKGLKKMLFSICFCLASIAAATFGALQQDEIHLFTSAGIGLMFASPFALLLILTSGIKSGLTPSAAPVLSRLTTVISSLRRTEHEASCGK